MWKEFVCSFQILFCMWKIITGRNYKIRFLNRVPQCFKFIYRCSNTVILFRWWRKFELFQKTNKNRFLKGHFCFSVLSLDQQFLLTKRSRCCQQWKYAFEVFESHFWKQRRYCHVDFVVIRAADDDLVCWQRFRKRGDSAGGFQRLFLEKQEGIQWRNWSKIEIPERVGNRSF